MTEYDFTTCLSSLDFELLSKDLLEAELGIQFENFSEGRDKGIDLRYAPQLVSANPMVANSKKNTSKTIVQCKRYSSFSNLKSELKNKELPKIKILDPARYILTTSVPLSVSKVDELEELLSPYIRTSGDIYGKERLNSLLNKHKDIERRHLKLWIKSSGVLEAIVNSGTHIVSRDEIERTVSAAKLYVKNPSFDEALKILREQHVCIISGQPGIGKTTLARMLLLYFYRKNYEIIKIESDISEAHKVSYSNKPRFYYYDDFLGQTAQADKLNKNEDQKLIDFMSNIRASKDSVFVLTTREYILNQARSHYEKLSREKFNHRTCVIDLAKYSRHIKAQILYNHLHFSDLPRQHVESLVKERGYIKIIDHKNYNPRLIEFMTKLDWIGDTSSKDYLNLFLKNLNNPVEIWGHAFDYQLSTKAKNLLYVITTMPIESLIDDLKSAFLQFHNAFCKESAIGHTADDFINALKELDGTFISIRQIQSSSLVQFQNPSIRDFMHSRIVTSGMLGKIIDSAIFFEQVQRFAAAISNKEKHPSWECIADFRNQIIVALKRLWKTDGCSVFIFGNPPRHTASYRQINLAERLSIILMLSTPTIELEMRSWAEENISWLVKAVRAGKIRPDDFISPLEDLREYGFLDLPAGRDLVLALREMTLAQSYNYIDEFETITRLISALPSFLSETELDNLRGAYADFTEQYVDECDLSNPEELREEASRIRSIGDILDVETHDAQSVLRKAADEIEREESYGPDDYEGGSSGIPTESCSDSEIDSMFGTLTD